MIAKGGYRRRRRARHRPAAGRLRLVIEQQFHQRRRHDGRRVDHHRQLPGQRDGAVPRHFIKQFTAETGINVNYNETNYDSWYQNCKNDGLNKTGAYDIYVMDDNWVPEFAAGKIVQSLDELGFKVNPGHPAQGTGAGLLAAEVRRRG